MERDPLSGVAVFVAAARAGTFTEAAGRLGLTKSAVGKTIARLEERLGFKLFHRTTRLTKLTADGEAYFAACAVWPRQRHLSPRVRYVVDQLVAYASRGRLD